MSNTEAEQNNPEVEDSARPEGLPENFKSVADLAKSYQEIVGARTQDRQELSSLRTELGEFKQAWEQQTAPDPEDPIQVWTERTGFDAETVQQFAQLADAVAKQNLNAYQQQQQQSQSQAETQSHLLAYTADQIVASKYGDWEDYKGKVREAVLADPALIPDSAYTRPDLTANALERVYKLVKAEDAYNQLEAGTLQVDQGRQNKINAQTMSGAAGRPGEASDDEEWYARVKAAASSGSYSARMGSSGL